MPHICAACACALACARVVSRPHLARISQAVEWHAGKTCIEYRAHVLGFGGVSMESAAADDQDTMRMLREGKQCPKCGMSIIHYRGHGCHHIRPGGGRRGGCPTCGHHFCYVCLGPHNECGCPWQVTLAPAYILW